MTNELPPRAKSTGRKPKYKFADLQLNDYITVKQADKVSAGVAAGAYGKRSGKTFATRTVETDGKKEVRIYRTQ